MRIRQQAWRCGEVWSYFGTETPARPARQHASTPPGQVMWRDRVLNVQVTDSVTDRAGTGSNLTAS
jgi:hypothetical protein